MLSRFVALSVSLIKKASPFQGRLRRFVVDEVHCVAIDGNDFRPDYMKLAVLRTNFENVPIIGCTATATSQVLGECQQALQLRGACVFQGDFDRPNLFLSVRRKEPGEKAHLAQLGKLIRAESDGETTPTGIVYCFSKKECDNYAAALRDDFKIVARGYHAGMSDVEQNEVHAGWRDGRIKVVCATIAFGMGINAPHCRFVIHSTMAKGLDSYWQEAGRAGRDGSLAACTIFARGADLTRVSSMVAECPQVVNRKQQLQRLYTAFSFALEPAGECRRRALLRWFGQDPREAVERCGKHGRCDVCDKVIASDRAEEGASVEVTEGVRSVLQVMARLEQRQQKKTTLIKLAEAWRSSGAAHAELRQGRPAHGETPIERGGYPKDDCECVVAMAVCKGFLDERFVPGSYNYNCYVALGAKGRRVLDGSETLSPISVWLSSKAAGKAGKKRKGDGAAKGAGAKAARGAAPKPKPKPQAAKPKAKAKVKAKAKASGGVNIADAFAAQQAAQAAHDNKENREGRDSGSSWGSGAQAASIDLVDEQEDEEFLAAAAAAEAEYASQRDAADPAADSAAAGGEFDVGADDLFD